MMVEKLVGAAEENFAEDESQSAPRHQQRRTEGTGFLAGEEVMRLRQKFLDSLIFAALHRSFRKRY
jgi:hypothetical protein